MYLPNGLDSTGKTGHGRSSRVAQEVAEGDRLLDVQLSDGMNDVVLITMQGKAIRSQVKATRGSGWRVELDNGAAIEADALALAALPLRPRPSTRRRSCRA